MACLCSNGRITSVCNVQDCACLSIRNLSSLRMGSGMGDAVGVWRTRWTETGQVQSDLFGIVWQVRSVEWSSLLLVWRDYIITIAGAWVQLQNELMLYLF